MHDYPRALAFERGHEDISLFGAWAAYGNSSLGSLLEDVADDPFVVILRQYKKGGAFAR
jgi:hypothetical protein